MQSFYILSIMFLILACINVGLWVFINMPKSPYIKYDKIMRIAIALLFFASGICLVVYIQTSIT